MLERELGPLKIRTVPNNVIRKAICRVQLTVVTAQFMPRVMNVSATLMYCCVVAKRLNASSCCFDVRVTKENNCFVLDVGGSESAHGEEDHSRKWAVEHLRNA